MKTYSASRGSSQGMRCMQSKGKIRETDGGGENRSLTIMLRNLQEQTGGKVNGQDNTDREIL